MTRDREDDNVVRLPTPAEATLDKRALAQHFGVSTRAIEKYTQEGMPKGPLNRHGRRLYSLSACEEWRKQRPAPLSRPQSPALEERVRRLEEQMELLLRRHAAKRPDNNEA